MLGVLSGKSRKKTDAEKHPCTSLSEAERVANSLVYWKKDRKDLNGGQTMKHWSAFLGEGTPLKHTPHSNHQLVTS